MKSETFQDIFVQQVVVQTKCAKRKIRSLPLHWKIKSYSGESNQILCGWTELQPCMVWKGHATPKLMAMENPPDDNTISSHYSELVYNCGG